MTSGAPARGTEIVQLQVFNTSLTKRTLFLDPSSHLFLIRLRYTKTFSNTNIEQNAVRAIPPCLSYILLLYLVIIEPFKRYLLWQLDQDQDQTKHHLLSHTGYKLVDTRRLTKLLSQRAEKEAGQQGLGLSTWRHLALGFIRYSLGETIIDSPESIGVRPHDGSDEAISAQLMHHAPITGEMVYARSGAILPQLTLTVQDRFVSFAKRWHDFLGLGANFSQFGSIYPQIPLPKGDLAIRSQPVPATEAVAQVVAQPQYVLFAY